jgi:hypothetical protein
MKPGAAPNGFFISWGLTCVLQQRWGHPFEGGTEGHVTNIDIAGDLQRIAPRDDTALAGDFDQFTPVEFFKDAGTLIAVCLWLGLLMQLLLG